MKKEIYFYSLILMSVLLIQSMTFKTHAQDYLISFAGTGASTTVDSVKVENLTQCKSITVVGSDILHLGSSVGIDDLNISIANCLQIYPNPMNGVCSLEFVTTGRGRSTISLFNIHGKTIFQEEVFLPEGHHTYSLGGINSGTYFIKVESDKHSNTGKIVSTNKFTGVPAIKLGEMITTVDKQISNSQSVKTSGLKEVNSVIDMQYTSGDVLKFTGRSGIYQTVFMLVPVQSQTVDFNFVACTDADSNNYPVVQIGAQLWMAENLKTTRYRNGDAIQNVTGNTAWRNLTTGAYCWYNNDSGTYASVYGALYNWYSLNDSRNLAPTGWHVPTDAEWTVLTTFLGGTNTAGGKVKETCSTYWQEPNAGATNETGFTALPNGYRFLDGSFDENGNWSVWWCSTSSSSTDAPTRAAFYNYVDLGRDVSDKNDGFALRCVKD